VDLDGNFDGNFITYQKNFK